MAWKIFINDGVRSLGILYTISNCYKSKHTHYTHMLACLSARACMKRAQGYNVLASSALVTEITRPDFALFTLISEIFELR